MRGTAGRPHPTRATLALLLSGCVTTAVLTGLGPTAAAGPTGAPGAPGTDRFTFTAAVSRPRACFAARTTRPGVDGIAVTSTVDGYVRVRLAPLTATLASSDWDVAVFDEASGRLLGASAAPRSNEVADARVTRGQRLWLQGCRYAGRAPQVRVSTAFVASRVSAETSGTAQLVAVTTPSPAARRALSGLDLDVTDPASLGSGPPVTEVVLHGAADTARLRATGLPFRVEVADLAADAVRARRADAAYAATTSRSGLPSGRTAYRHLWDYDHEMKELARRHPSSVRSITLPERSHEGRDISGLEITRHVRRTDDGKPVFVNAGLIHAREWPSGELPMEWAYDLVRGDGRDRRTTRLVRTTRSIVVPVVNPDGFSASREDPVENGSDPTGYGDPRRKNCDPTGAPAGSGQSMVCAAASSDLGVDLNRNFGAFWGGPGASPDWGDETYRGTAPFSEPESRALRDLVSSRQVTNLVMNHTASGLVLRPPGAFAEGTPVDEPLLARLGQRMADHNGFPSIPVYGLTDATGGADEWAYWVGGTLAETIEIGTPGFHPAFADVVAQYLGRAPAQGAGKGGNRASYFAMLESTARVRDHAQLTGRAPRGWTLQLHKTVRTPTSPVEAADGSTGKPLLVRDTFTSTLRSRGGRFRWAVNPSTRPYVAGRYGRDPQAPDQGPTTLVNPPGEGPLDDGTGTAGRHEEAGFTVAAPPQADVGTATVTVTWSRPDTLWLVDVVRADGGDVVASYSGDATSSVITLHDPKPGRYVVEVVREPQPEGEPFDDWAGRVTFAGPTPAVPGTTEPWSLTCRRPDGSTAATRRVVVKRGWSVDVGRGCRH